MSREKPVRVVVLRTAGTNCDVETAYAFEKVGAEAERVHVNRLAENRRGLDRFHILAIPGGFSYGDDIASGKVLANEIRYRMEDEVRRFVADGKLIIGICNGFQVLAKAGLLPRLHGDTSRGDADHQRPRAFRGPLGAPARRRKPVRVRASGRFTLPAGRARRREVHRGKKRSGRDRAEETGRRAVRRPGRRIEPRLPWNPNGSVADIAGICDPTGRIFGLMPHPERHVEPTQHPRWTREGAKPEGDGVRVFRNAVDFARRNLV